MEFIDKSVRYFNRGKYRKALSRFTRTILESYPEDVNANFYAGLCLSILENMNLV